MTELRFDAEKIIGKVGEKLATDANPCILSDCDIPREDLAEDEPEPDTCAHFQAYHTFSTRSDGANNLNCRLDTAIKTGNSDKVEELIKEAKPSCPLIRTWVMLKALKASETNTE